jgi:succinate dehydrogenase/fumarate reductase flavoprotein subunit
MGTEEASTGETGTTGRYDCDFLIIGSGAAAMSAAVTATAKGLKVLIVEKEATFGGASARSGGCPWIPCSPHAAALGYHDSREEAEAFIRFEAGDRYDEATVSAFLDNGPKMLSFIEQNSPVRFGFLAGVPDYHCDSPGGSTTGRVLFPMSWDAAPLGEELERLRPPLEASTFMTMHIGTNEAQYYLTAGRKLRSAIFVLRCLLLRLRDQVRAGRTMRLGLGNALVGGLASAFFQKGGQLWTCAPAKSLITQRGRVTGATVDTEQGRIEVMAKRGVLIATGGFPHDSALRADLFPPGQRAAELWALFPYGNAGDGIKLAREAGARFERNTKSPIAFAPAMRLSNVEGALEAMPAFFNRGMPGVIAVTRSGKRFCNEGRSYHDFCVNLLDVTPPGDEPLAWLIFDHRSLRRYGMGPIYPWPMPYRHHLKSGFLKRGASLQDLAAAAGINAGQLEETVADYNRHARLGVDPEFHRGTNAFDLSSGDADHKPNPSVGPLDQAPYYAIRIFAGCVGTFAGLKTNGKGEVLNEEGLAIPGLYAAGNDMLSITGGDYIAGGCTIGPGLTFGYIVGNEVSA